MCDLVNSLINQKFFGSLLVEKLCIRSCSYLDLAAMLEDWKDC